MKIGFFETIPILQAKLEKELSASPFRESVFLEKAKGGSSYHILLCDKNYLPENLPFQSEIFLVPGSLSLPHFPQKGQVLSGGMNREDAVSFSSIGESEAMIYLGQEILIQKKSIMPFEQKVPFDRNFSLYKNLATGFVLSLLTQVFTEEP